MTGIIIGERIRADNEVQWGDYLLVLANYFLLHIVRFLCILTFWPLMKFYGYGMTFKQVTLSSYAGLRGAVGLALAMIVLKEEKIPRYVRDIMFLHVAGVALLTLLINATTTGMLVRKLGLSRQSDVKKGILV